LVAHCEISIDALRSIGGDDKGRGSKHAIEMLKDGRIVLRRHLLAEGEEEFDRIGLDDGIVVGESNEFWKDVGLCETDQGDKFVCGRGSC